MLARLYLKEQGDGIKKTFVSTMEKLESAVFDEDRSAFLEFKKMFWKSIIPRIHNKGKRNRLSRDPTRNVFMGKRHT